MDPRSLRALSAAYCEWLRVTHYSVGTADLRAEILAGFSNWCEERDVRAASEVTKPILESYQRWLFHYRKQNGKALGVTTQYERLSIIRGFFRWCAKQNHILYNPASDLVLPRSEKRLPRHVLNAREMELVLTQPDVTDAVGLRDRAILETLYSTGMRRMEVRNLGLYDVDHDRGTVMIRQGKGRKDRVVPVGSRVLTWIEKYVNEARPNLVAAPDPGFLFLSLEGGALDDQYLSTRMRWYVDAAQLGKTGGCHLIRHTMATVMLENGADIRFIQAMLGHARLTTTEIYTRVSVAKLKEIHNATHPSAWTAEKQRSSVAAEDLVESLPTEETD